MPKITRIESRLIKPVQKSVVSPRLPRYRQQGAIKPLDYRNMEKDSESNQALLFWGTTNISSSQPEWFHNDVTSERIIKVVVENEGAR